MKIREILQALLQLMTPEAYIWDASQEFAGTHQNAIGLVVQPGPRTSGRQLVTELLRAIATNPMNFANFWGHTGMFVRQNGRIVQAIGYDPHRLRMWSPSGLQVGNGLRPTTGFYYPENVMFRSPDVMIVEFPMPGSFVRAFLNELPGLGTAQAGNFNFHTQYLTFGGTKLGPAFVYNPQVMGNCIDACQRFLRSRGYEIRLGNTRIGPSQGRLTAIIKRNQPLTLVRLAQGPSGREFVHNSTIRGPAMVWHRRMIRRLHNTNLVFSLIHAPVNTQWLIGSSQALVSGGEMGALPAWFAYDFFNFIDILFSFLMETLPPDSPFWRLRPEMLQFFFAAMAKLCFWWTVYTGAEWAWMEMLLLISSLIYAAFG